VSCSRRDTEDESPTRIVPGLDEQPLELDDGAQERVVLHGSAGTHDLSTSARLYHDRSNRTISPGAAGE
jgi:hypothetical protein